MSTLGLKRGVKGSTAKHTKVKEYYERVNQKTEVPSGIPKIDLPGRFLSKEQQRLHITQEVKKKLLPLYNSARSFEAKSRELEAENKNLKSRLRWYEAFGKRKEFKELFNKLKKYVAKVVLYDKTVTEKRYAEKAEKIRKSFLYKFNQEGDVNVRRSNKRPSIK